jgi:acyl dehydratase
VFIERQTRVTGWLSLTQERVEQFAKATEDRQWIHLDRERASTESPYATTIAHGFLTLSFVSYIVREAITIRGVRISVNYGTESCPLPFPCSR